MSITFDIRSLAKQLYPEVKLDEESELFLNTYIESYVEKVKEQSYRGITPKSVRRGMDVKSSRESFSKIAIKLAEYLLKNVLECYWVHNQKKLYPSCIIIAISKNNGLIELTHNVGKFIIPHDELGVDSRSNKELRKYLRPKFKGISDFSKNELLYLAQPVSTKLIMFYMNRYKLDGESFNDIVEGWDDYKLEVDSNYIYWLFPSEMSDRDLNIFRTSSMVRSNVVKASIRMLLFYGYVMDDKEIVKRVKPLNRKEGGVTVGLFSVINYDRLTRIMEFLNKIGMEFISTVFMLALCKAMRENEVLYKMVLDSKEIIRWKSTQLFVR